MYRKFKVRKKKNDKILNMVEIQAESPLCKWGRGRGVICEEKMFDAVLRFLKKSANVQNDGRKTLSDRRSSQLWSDATLKRPRPVCFQPTCVSEKEPLILLYCCKIHPRRGSRMEGGQARLFLVFCCFFVFFLNPCKIKMVRAVTG